MHQTTSDADSHGPDMSARTYDLCVFIGRFQPFHCAHLRVVQEALRHARHVAVLIGSANEPRNVRNPFTASERADMIRLSIDPLERDRVMTSPLEDTLYNDVQWIRNVQAAVARITAEIDARDRSLGFKGMGKPRIALIGHSKDGSSYYLRRFPQWDSIEVANIDSIDGTKIRKAYFSNIAPLFLADADGHKVGDLPQDKIMPTATRDFLTAFLETRDYAEILAEYEHIRTYRSAWAKAPYQPVFVTVDACVVQSGFVLLVRRKGRPGRGLWALPGGFIKPDEELEDGMLRELKEETKIAVPVPVLRGSIETHREFSCPYRSSRGRTITFAWLIQLREEVALPNLRSKQRVRETLAQVQGADDAEVAQWWPLSEVTRSMMFEDHYDIILNLTARV